MPFSYERTQSFPLHVAGCRCKRARHTKLPRRPERYRGQSFPRLRSVCPDINDDPEGPHSTTCSSAGEIWRTERSRALRRLQR
jgi:hypothetical protein